MSPATVSRYLNNQPGQMTEETRARIAEVIERTGYRPRSAARNLRNDKSNLIGVVLADVSNPYSSAMLESLSKHAGDAGYSLMTAFSSGDPATEASALARLIDSGVDGLIVNTCGDNDQAVGEAAKRVPTVLLDRPVEAASADLVTSDNVRLTEGLVQELTSAGCATIYLLTEAGDSSAVRRIRCQTFEASLAARGIAGEVLTLDAERDAGAAQIDHCLVRAAGGSLGLICVNGLVFLRLVEVVAALGPVLPQGMRIATFDDYPWNHVLFGGVTTAAQDTDTIACAVLERLLKRVDIASKMVGDSARVESVVLELPGRIVRRASTEGV